MIFIRLLPALLFVFGGLSVYDQEWSLWLHQRDFRPFSQWFDQSLLSGQNFGGADLPVFLAVFSALLYALSLFEPFGKFRSHSWTAYLPALLVLTAVTTHALKISIGRARPYDVWSGKEEYSEWFQFGSHWIGEGIFSGSFTSGHTAATITFLGMGCYLYNHEYVRKRLFYHLGALLFVILAFSYMVAMGISRSMLAYHWITDTSGSILIGIAWSYLLYFHIFRIHEQRLFYQKYKRTAVLSRIWEVFSVGYLVGIIFCFAVLVISIRAIWTQDPLLSLLAVPASALSWWLGRKLKLLNEQVQYELNA